MQIALFYIKSNIFEKNFSIRKISTISALIDFSEIQSLDRFILYECKKNDKG